MRFKTQNSFQIQLKISTRLRDEIKTVIGEEIPVYNFNFDLSPDNKKIYGLCAMTKELLVCAFTEKYDGKINLNILSEKKNELGPGFPGQRKGVVVYGQSGRRAEICKKGAHL